MVERQREKAVVGGKKNQRNGRVGVGCGVRERQSWVGQGAEKAHLMTKQHFDFYENI